MRPLYAFSIAAIFLIASGCNCGGNVKLSEGPAPKQPAPQTDTVPADTVPVGGGVGSCSTDCDCAAGEHCVASSNAELPENHCEAGTSLCSKPCAVACGAGTACVNGVCTVLPCPNCGKPPYTVSV